MLITWLDQWKRHLPSPLARTIRRRQSRCISRRHFRRKNVLSTNVSAGVDALEDRSLLSAVALDAVERGLVKMALVDRLIPPAFREFGGCHEAP